MAGTTPIRSTSVLHEVASNERNQESLALLKILPLGTRQIDAGKTKSARAVVAAIRERRTK